MLVSWGDTEYGPAVVPHWAELPVEDRDRCRQKLGLQLADSQMCAGPGHLQQEPCGVGRVVNLRLS